MFLFQRFIMILTEHIVSCENRGAPFHTPWFNYSIQRLQQIFIVVSPLSWNKYMWCEKILTEHIVSCENRGAPFHTPWFNYLIQRLQQIFIVVSPLWWNKYMWCEKWRPRQKKLFHQKVGWTFYKQLSKIDIFLGQIFSFCFLVWLAWYCIVRHRPHLTVLIVTVT